jgi:hypothetical protein
MLSNFVLDKEALVISRALEVKGGIINLVPPDFEGSMAPPAVTEEFEKFVSAVILDPDVDIATASLARLFMSHSEALTISAPSTTHFVMEKEEIELSEDMEERFEQIFSFRPNLDGKEAFLKLMSRVLFYFPNVAGLGSYLGDVSEFEGFESAAEQSVFDFSDSAIRRLVAYPMKDSIMYRLKIHNYDMKQAFSKSIMKDFMAAFLFAGQDTRKYLLFRLFSDHPTASRCCIQKEEAQQSFLRSIGLDLSDKESIVKSFRKIIARDPNLMSAITNKLRQFKTKF